MGHSPTHITHVYSEFLRAQTSIRNHDPKPNSGQVDVRIVLTRLRTHRVVRHFPGPKLLEFHHSLRHQQHAQACSLKAAKGRAVAM